MCAQDLHNPPKLELCTQTLGLYADPTTYTEIWIACRLVRQALAIA
jgi:hypothetical protein